MYLMKANQPETLQMNKYTSGKRDTVEVFFIFIQVVLSSDAPATCSGDLHFFLFSI